MGNEWDISHDIVNGDCPAMFDCQMASELFGYEAREGFFKPTQRLEKVNLPSLLFILEVSPIYNWDMLLRVLVHRLINHSPS